MTYHIQLQIALPKLRVVSKKQVFEAMAHAIAKETGLGPEFFLNSANDEKRQLSSDIGNGIAVPHIQHSAFKRRYVVLATLDQPLNLDAFDNIPVDIFCSLLSPASDGPMHLRALSRITRLLKNDELAHKLRETSDADVMKSLFTNPEGWLLAA